MLKKTILKKTKNILITGGAGFIGSHLAEKLLLLKHKITILDDFSTGTEGNIKHIIKNKNLRVIRGSTTDDILVSKCVARSSLVYHLAATVGVKNVVDNPVETLMYDTFGTELVLKYASAKGIKVIVTSTSEVYGKSEKVPYKEDADLVIGPPTVSRWSYACSKLLDEFLTIAYHKEGGLPFVIARLFNVVGPRQTGKYGMVIPRFFKNAFKNIPITIYGDGEQTRCFTYVDDIVKLLIEAAGAEKANGQIINLGGNNKISIKDLAVKIKELTKSSSQLIFEPYVKYYGKNFEDVKERIPDLTKLKDIIGYIPSTGMDEILKNIKKYYDSNPEAVNRL